MARLCSRNFWRLWFATRSGFNRLAHSQRALKIHRETSNWVAGLHLHFQAAQFLLDLLSFLLALSQRKASRRPARAGAGCLSLSLSLPGMEAGQSLRASCPPEVVAHWFPLSLSLSRRPRIAPCVVNSHEISVVRAFACCTASRA